MTQQPNDVRSLRSRVIRAGSWTLGGHLVGHALRLVSNLIMARLLAPEMFGVMSLATVIIVGLQLFSDLGLGQGIVQSSRGNQPSYLNTVWTVQIIRGALIWLFGLAFALAIHLLDARGSLPSASVYANPLVPSVIVVLSFSAFLGGFTSTRISTASRDLALGRLMLVELTHQLGALLFMVAWAVFDRTVWALVGGAVFATTLRVLLSHAALPGQRNTLCWDASAFREIFRFGKWIFVTSFLGFLALNGDRLLLGWLTDSRTMGLYAIAFVMVNGLQDVFLKLSHHVAFPAFSEVVRERRPALRQTYYRVRLPFDVATLVTAGLLFSAGHLVIDLFFDDRYLAAGHIMEILAVGLFEVRYSLANQCFMAMGLPKLMVPSSLVRLIVLFGVMPAAYELFGLDGALWTITGSLLLTVPVVIYLSVRYGIFELKRELLVLPFLGIGYFIGITIAQGAAFVSAS